MQEICCCNDFYGLYLEKYLYFSIDIATISALVTVGCVGPSHSMSQPRVVARSTDLFKPSQFCKLSSVRSTLHASMKRDHITGALGILQCTVQMA